MDKRKKVGKHKTKVEDDNGKVKERRGKELSKKMMTKDDPLNEEDLKDLKIWRKKMILKYLCQFMRTSTLMSGIYRIVQNNEIKGFTKKYI